MDTRRRSITLRILAPVALIAAGVALVMIVSSASSGGGSGSGTSPSAAEKARDLGAPTKTRKPRRSSGKLPTRFYVVKSGDTLGSISEVTGVPVQKLQDLNPGLDQFALRTGQKLKLR
jgi:LysM repeat protein